MIAASDLQAISQKLDDLSSLSACVALAVVGFWRTGDGESGCAADKGSDR